MSVPDGRTQNEIRHGQYHFRREGHAQDRAPHRDQQGAPLAAAQLGAQGRGGDRGRRPRQGARCTEGRPSRSSCVRRRRAWFTATRRAARCRASITRLPSSRNSAALPALPMVFRPGRASGLLAIRAATQPRSSSRRGSHSLAHGIIAHPIAPCCKSVTECPYSVRTALRAVFLLLRIGDLDAAESELRSRGLPCPVAQKI